MLAKIPLLTALLFATLYPLCFWINVREPLGHGFHRFHLGLAGVTGGVAVTLMTFMEIPTSLKVSLAIWLGLFLIVSALMWSKDVPNLMWISAVSIVGLVLYAQAQSHLLGPGLDLLFFSILGGLILCLSIFAMNMGHWYLNVRGLSVSHLQQVVTVFGAVLLTRILLDGWLLLTDRIIYGGIEIPLYSFVMTIEGFLLIVALLFGTVFPLITLFFVRGTLSLKATQSATGILYATLCSVLIGDLSYKYYALTYNCIL